MHRLAVTARFRPEHAEQVRELLEAGPPYDLAETGLERHAVYLSSREAVFVFEGADVEAEVDDLADDFFHPRVRDALTAWRPLLNEEPHIGQSVFFWARGGPDEPLTPGLAVTVADVMATELVQVSPDDTLGEAVERMAADRADLALVVDYGRLIGQLAAGDVLRGVAERVHPSGGRVREWMSDVPATIGSSAALDAAAEAMVEAGVHHLPVVDGERPLGLVTLRAAVGARPDRR